MNNYIIFLISLLAIFINYFCLLKLIPFLSKIFVDKPNERSSHKVPIARAGGVTFVLIGTIFSGFLGSFVQLICLPLAIVGLLDDRYNISSVFRFFAQSLTVLFLCNSSNLFFLFDNIFLDYFLVTFSFFSGLAIINFINFMDGIDGLVSGCMIIILSTIAFKYMPSLWPLIGALIGFIFLNWYPAKLFMGDVGSTFLGAIYFGSLLHSNSWNQALGLLLISSPLLGDALICVFRRFFNGENIFSAHSSHLYQRLYKSGITHDKVTLIYLLSTLILSLGWFLGGLIYEIILLIPIILTGLWLDYKISVSFKK